MGILASSFVSANDSSVSCPETHDKTICGESTATLEAKEGLAILKAKAESCEERMHGYLGLPRSLAPHTVAAF